VSSLHVWFLLASGRLEMTGEIVTVEIAGQRQPSRSGFTAGMTSSDAGVRTHAQHKSTRAQETAQPIANDMRAGGESQA